MRYALTTGASRLAGIIEADEVFTPESFKGRRQMPRPARRHGRRGHGHVPLVPALIAMDRYGRESDAVLLDKGLREIKPVLQPLLTAGSILCTDGNQSYIKIAEAGAGIIHKRLIAKEHHRVEDEVFHIQTLNNYVSRWRGWMEKFHGVGTAYLANSWRGSGWWYRSPTRRVHGCRVGSSDSPTRKGNCALILPQEARV